MSDVEALAHHRLVINVNDFGLSRANHKVLQLSHFIHLVLPRVAIV